MTESLKQTTLASPFSLSGIGIHTGTQANITVNPAAANSGICFKTGQTTIPAQAQYVVNTRRCTCLGNEDQQISTVEHLLSALYGMGVDNALIEVDGKEIPVLDGSALPWVECIQSVGRVALEEEVHPVILRETVSLKDGDSWMVAQPAASFSITCVTYFDHPLLGLQSDTFIANTEGYCSDIAPARTFGFAAEVEALLKAGLALGGSLDNALIIHDDHFSSPLRTPQECLRHKVLDLWGDLSLCGGRLLASVTAILPGHKINTAFAALLAQKTSN